jgi:hypothetical protein
MAEPLAARSAQSFPNVQLVAITNKNSMEEMMKLKMKLAVAVLLTIGLSSAAAYADSITVTIMTPGYIGVGGGSVTFNATVSAPTSNLAPVFLNGDSFNISGPFNINDNDFFANFPVDLTPGGSFTGPLFVVTGLPGTPFGTYLGAFELLGGANGNANTVLNPLAPGTLSNFSVITTPEPSSIVLLLTGMAGLARTRFKGSLRGWVR